MNSFKNLNLNIILAFIVKSGSTVFPLGSICLTSTRLYCFGFPKSSNVNFLTSDSGFFPSNTLIWLIFYSFSNAFSKDIDAGFNRRVLTLYLFPFKWTLVEPWSANDLIGSNLST